MKKIIFFIILLSVFGCKEKLKCYECSEITNIKHIHHSEIDKEPEIITFDRNCYTEKDIKNVEKRLNYDTIGVIGNDSVKIHKIGYCLEIDYNCFCNKNC